MNRELRSLVQAGRFGDALEYHCTNELEYNYIMSSAERANVDIERCLYSFMHFIIMSRVWLDITPLQVEVISKIQSKVKNAHDHLMINMPIGSGKTTLARLASAWILLRAHKFEFAESVKYITVIQQKARNDMKEIIKILERFNISNMTVEDNKMLVNVNNKNDLLCEGHGANSFWSNRPVSTIIVDEYDKSPHFIPKPLGIFYAVHSISIGTWADVDLSNRTAGVHVEVMDVTDRLNIGWIKS
jgi:hypothetical protein